MLSIDRIRGVILGTAIGDALGYPVEFQDIHPSSPVVSGYSTIPYLSEIGKWAHASGLYSDDTQMMRAVLEGLWRARTWVDFNKAAIEVATEFVAWLRSPENNRAPGNACLHGCRNLEANGVHGWRSSGREGARGCGTAMRSMAYGLWFPNDSAEAATWAAEHAGMTHRSSEARAAAAAVAAGVSAALQGVSPPTIAGVMIVAAREFDSEVADLLDEVTLTDDNADRLLDRLRGWTGAEAVAASLWCFLQHPENYESAVLLAVNSPGDSDSLGAITGALSGAHLGSNAIPPQWVIHIEKREELEVLAVRIHAATEGCDGIRST